MTSTAGPQKDVLFKQLTPREHLQLYSTLKGVVSEDLDTEVEFRLKQVGLGIHFV